MAVRKRRHLKINLRIALLFFCILTVGIFHREYRKYQEKKKLIDLPQIHAQGELRALTLYSPMSYFNYRDKEMGYEYELCSMLANDLGLHLKMIVAPDPSTMMKMLEKGEGDVIAFNMPITTAYKKKFEYCGREFLTRQVLVQQRKAPAEMVNGVTSLIGKKVVVHENSQYLSRLKSLNQELGGGINIQVLPNDSLSDDELIEKVALGEIDYTVSNNALAQFNSTFYPNISAGLAISFAQHSSWMVRKSSPKLAQAIRNWFKNNLNSTAYKDVTQRYFEAGKYPSASVSKALLGGKRGTISMFDALFRKYAVTIGWDWRLLASIAYQESKFDASAVNWTGARGLMQIMPKTAKTVGIAKESLFHADQNILAATRLLKEYEQAFSMISNNEQRTKMTLAAYNCGLGHITDARALTRKHGKNPFKWENNVRTYILLKSRPEYYEDKVCQQGYLRGTETAGFVDEVWKRYMFYKKQVPDKPQLKHLKRKKRHR